MTDDDDDYIYAAVLSLSALSSSKINKTLEWRRRLKSEFEGGIAFDEERNKFLLKSKRGRLSRSNPPVSTGKKPDVRFFRQSLRALPVSLYGIIIIIV